MVTPAQSVIKSNLHQRLFVYECLGPGLPSSQPDDSSFLGVWPEPPYYYLFFSAPVDNLAAEWVQAQAGWELKDRYEIDYDQWQQVPGDVQQVGGFTISPFPIAEGPNQTPGKKVLSIDAGLVFGSGLHPTTRGCLLALERLFEEYRIRDVVDFGTGTGILAAACALLGARRVLAVDCNLMAVNVARKNFAANEAGGIVRAVVADDPGVFRSSSHLILMNIEWPCLTRILRGPHWRRHALAVLSGFVEAQREELQDLIPESHLLIHEQSHDGWITLVLKAKGAEPPLRNSVPAASPA